MLKEIKYCLSPDHECYVSIIITHYYKRSILVIMLNIIVSISEDMHAIKKATLTVSEIGRIAFPFILSYQIYILDSKLNIFISS